jgi:hypothetical protein
MSFSDRERPVPDGVSVCTFVLVTHVNRAQLVDELEGQGASCARCQYLYLCTSKIVSICTFVH